MSPERPLPPHPSLEQQKKLAKELLASVRAGEPAARARVRRQLPDRERVTLADAQFVLAREYGFESWAKLKQHIEQQREEPPRAGVEEEFRRAVHTRNAPALRALLASHPEARALLDAPLFSFDSPALVHVAGDSDPALLDVLLEYGADPNRRSQWGPGAWHALHSARGAVADRLLAAGAVMDACAAAQLDRLDDLQRLIADDPARVHERGGDGQTPLHFARSRAVVDVLLGHGADIDARDRDHRGTPAEWMLERRRGAGRYALAQYLVERGATADVFLAAALGLTARLRALLDADSTLLSLRTGQEPYGEQPGSSQHIYTWSIGQNLSPLQVAAQFEQEDALALMRRHASPSALFLDACANARADEASRLLREDRGLLDRLSIEEQRVLPDAAWAGNTDAVALMLELGFDPAVTGASGGTVLHNAAWEGIAACVAVVLRHPRGRSLLHERDAVHGGTPLGWCCHGASNCGNPAADHAAVARVLLDAGAAPDVDPDHVRADVAEVIRAYRARTR